MIHGYDDQGSRFGPTGNFENWWSDADREAFEARAAGLVEQFAAYEVLPGLKVNGNLTLGENIADLGGLAVAYDAMTAATAGMPDPMIDGLSRDQRIYIGYAVFYRAKWAPDSLTEMDKRDPHAQSEFRTTGAVPNRLAFAAAIHCIHGDKM